MGVKRFLLMLLLNTIVATCASAAPGDTRWHVILAAVGNEQNVFDNFINDFASLLKGRSDIASLVELHASVDARWQASGLEGLDRSLRGLTPLEGEGCLVYMTGHGAPDGIALSADSPTVYVRATRMESMLNSCSGRPTVLIISACFSGIYMKPGITRAERVVMTASAADLPSFGCSNNLKYTFFDQCFMDAWPRHGNWGALADDINKCVRQTENRSAFPASKPQFFFGPGMRELALPVLVSN
jgi:Peptidase C13 family